jgi:sugar phosphate isomerase/epimerase
MPAGRPAKYKVDDIIKKLNDYISLVMDPSSNEVPRVIEFCCKYGISKSRLYELAKENEELADSIKRLVDYEERYLVHGAEMGNINATFAIFRLKQKPFNWSDKQEIESNNKNDSTIRIKLEGDLKEWSK